MIISEEYTANLRKYGTADGIKAISLYVIYIVVLFIQGYISTTNLSVGFLNLLQIVFPLALLIIGVFFILMPREKFSSVGLTRRNLFKSLSLGVILSVCFVTGMAVYFSFVREIPVHFQALAPDALGIFIIGAIQEEIIFRGYIQTRLSGALKNPILCSIFTALLFIFMHYPVRWAVGGVSFDALSAFYVICLLILHFLCDFVYKKTNCLWGAVILHFLYNIGQAMLV